MPSSVNEYDGEIQMLRMKEFSLNFHEYGFIFNRVLVFLLNMLFFVSCHIG